MFIAYIFFIGSLVVTVLGHGRLIEPPGRSTMWRYNFNTEPNYNDNELFCGGFDRQWHTNDGKCGICGDPWDAPYPRENEDGGRYGKGLVVRTFKQGQAMPVTVEITADHKGYFEFRLCPMTHKGQIADQDCLDRNILQFTDGTGSRYFLPLTSIPKRHALELQLPKNLTCERCVLQWHYNTGNRWGICREGIGTLGCGPQEVFRGCADISITKAEDITVNNKPIMASVQSKENEPSQPQKVPVPVPAGRCNN